MKIYTKKGDQGQTSLFRGGRVSKYSLRVNAYGTVDELNSYLGWIRSQGLDLQLDDWLEQIQTDLFVIGADLATPQEVVKNEAKVLRLPQDAQVFMEEAIDFLQSHLEPLMQFILPGGSPLAAAFHVARTITRRAEREVVGLQDFLQTEAELDPDRDTLPESVINPSVLIYLNRLSDLLFVIARYQNRLEGFLDLPWEK